MDLSDGSLVFSCPKKKETTLIRECVVIGRCISPRFEKYWNEMGVADDTNTWQFTSSSISIRRRWLRMVIGSENKESCIELVDTSTADFIYHSLPLVSTVKSIGKGYILLPLDRDFLRHSYGYVPVLGSEKNFEENHGILIGLWRKGHSLVLSFGKATQLPFSVSVIGRFRPILSKKSLKAKDFPVNEPIFFDRMY